MPIPIPRLHDGGSGPADLLSAEEVNARIAAVTLTGYDLGDLGATETIDLENGQIQYGTLDANTAITLPAPGATQQQYQIATTQDGTGGRLPTFAVADGTVIEWEGLGRQAPSSALMNTAPFATSIFDFMAGQGKIIGRLLNPRQYNILSNPSLIIDPREVSDSLFLWLDAADYSTITFNSSTISAVADKSGRGHTALQATSGAQPSLSTAANGQPALLFASGKSLKATDHADFQTTSFDCWVVLERPTDAGAAQSIVAQGANATGDYRFAMNVSSSDTPNFAISQDGTGSVGQFWNDSTANYGNTVDVPQIYRLAISDSDKVSTSWVYPVGYAVHETTRTALGASRYVGGTPLLTIGGSAMKVKELLYFGEKLSAANALLIESYLRNKHGIPAS